MSHANFTTASNEIYIKQPDAHSMVYLLAIHTNSCNSIPLLPKRLLLHSELWYKSLARLYMKETSPKPVQGKISAFSILKSRLKHHYKKLKWWEREAQTVTPIIQTLCFFSYVLGKDVILFYDRFLGCLLLKLDGKLERLSSPWATPLSAGELLEAIFCFQGW